MEIINGFINSSYRRFHRDPDTGGLGCLDDLTIVGAHCA